MPDVPYVKRSLLDAADRYEASIKSTLTPTMGNVKPKRLEGPPTSKEQAVAHLLWLCGQVRREAKEENFLECRANIHFICGALWYMGRDV
jgi:hypothetical protein